MNTSQLHDPEQQKEGVRGREDINGETKGKDGSVTSYNPTHPLEDHQPRINGSVLGVDNIGRARETKDRDPVPTKMTTNVTTPKHASSPFPDQEEKQKGALRQEDDHKTNDLSKDELLNNIFGGKNKSTTDKNHEYDAFSDSLDFSDVHQGIPIDVKNGAGARAEVQPISLITVNVPPPPSNNAAPSSIQPPQKFEAEVKVTFCCRCSIL